MSQPFIIAAAWLLLGLAVGLHFPDIDNRLLSLIPSWLLLHRSILTHGMLVSLLLLRLVRRREGAAPSLRLFAVGVSLAVAVHLCFDFFPRGWTGFALIHVPVYGRTTALFSQAWVLVSILACLYLGLLLLRNVLELLLGVVGLVVSFLVSVAEDGSAAPKAFMLLALAALVTAVIARRSRGAARRA
jgi:MYXO-CTERM domain-containing protein